ncbi:MAG: D-erythronate dehydrogenase [Casimicrobiaceae bacterium]
MRIIITGGCGFLGSRLAQRLLERNTLTDASGVARGIRRILLLDIAPPGSPTDDPRIAYQTGDLGDPATIERAFAGGVDSVFHMAAIVSGQAEADFDAGMRINLDATRLLLEHCRKLARPPKLVFASSLAVFGGALPDPVPDDAPLMPQASYGTQKAIGELLVHDMTRKGFVDGRSLRLPTVTVRPGKPNRAASSFASGIVREPLAGVDADCPVAPTTRMWVTSPRTVVDNLVIGHEAPATAFTHTRSVNVPGLCVGVGEMVDALREVAGEAVAARVHWRYDAAIDRIVSTWPANFAPRLGPALGMRGDDDFRSIVRAYIADDMSRN